MSYPWFTPDESFVLFSGERSDGTIETLAFSLLEQEPVAIPLDPAPAPYVGISAFCAGGVILRGGDSDELPYTGQIWWAPLGPSRFGPAVPLGDLSFNGVAELQPQP